MAFEPVRIIVSDTSPIRALDHLGLLEMLPKLFDEIVIPPAVLKEVESSRSTFKAVELAKYPWLKLRVPSDATRVKQLLQELDNGEAEAIIKMLVSFSDREWKLRQYQPARDFSESRLDWPVCHRIVGKRNVR